GYVDIDRIVDRFADVERLEQCQALDVGANQFGETQQHALALPRLAPAPGAALERRARRRHRGIDVHGLAARDLADDLAIDRTDVIEHAARARRHVAAVDEGTAFDPERRGAALPACP